eukprot:1328981-Ditylum_brightwellii.AAC.1
MPLSQMLLDSEKLSSYGLPTPDQVEIEMPIDELEEESASSLQAQSFFESIDHHDDPLPGCLDSLHHLALAVQITYSDMPDWGKDTQGRNANGFWEAM